MSGFTHDDVDSGVCTHVEFYRCHDCVADGYDCVVQDDVWSAAWGGAAPDTPGDDGPSFFLCRSCIERRVGRTLVLDDFKLCGLNVLHFARLGVDTVEFIGMWDADFYASTGEHIDAEAIVKAFGVVARSMRRSGD